MKCAECLDYLKCSKEHDLRMFRRRCPKAKEEKKQTNADRIRAMSDEELMGLLFNKIACGHICGFCVPTMRTEHKCDGHCRNGILQWLQQPAEE